MNGSSDQACASQAGSHDAGTRPVHQRGVWHASWPLIYRSLARKLVPFEASRHLARPPPQDVRRRALRGVAAARLVAGVSAGVAAAVRAATGARLGGDTASSRGRSVSLRAGGERARRAAGGAAVGGQPEPGVAGDAGAQQPDWRGGVAAPRGARAAAAGAARCAASALRARAAAAVGVGGGRRPARSGPGAARSCMRRPAPPCAHPPTSHALTLAPPPPRPAQRFGAPARQEHSFASAYASQARSRADPFCSNGC